MWQKNQTHEKIIHRAFTKTVGWHPVNQDAFLAKHRIPVLEPYLLDLPPHDFFFHTKVKSILKGTQFESKDAMKKKQWRG